MEGHALRPQAGGVVRIVPNLGHGEGVGHQRMAVGDLRRSIALGQGGRGIAAVSVAGRHRLFADSVGHHLAVEIHRQVGESAGPAVFRFQRHRLGVGRAEYQGRHIIAAILNGGRHGECHFRRPFAVPVSFIRPVLHQLQRSRLQAVGVLKVQINRLFRHSEGRIIPVDAGV